MSIETSASNCPDPEWDEFTHAHTVPEWKEPAPAAPKPVNDQLPPVESDPAATRPLFPQWVKTRAGWKARSGIAAVNSVRRFRRWLRRQATDHGHPAQVYRGLARTVMWVRGVEGVEVAKAKNDARIAHREYEGAKRDYNRKLIPGGEKDRLLKRMGKASEESAKAMNAYRKEAKAARARQAFRGAVAATPIAALETGGIYTAGSTGVYMAAGLTLAGLALLGRRTDAGDVWSDRDTKIGDGVKPDAGILDKAMREAGILTKADHTVELLLPAALDGKAWVMPVALSGGPTVVNVRARVTELAAAFGVPSYQVDVIDSGDGRGDRFTLWVSTTDPFKKVFVSPLTTKPVQVDAFGRGVLIGYNRRMEPIHLKMGHVMALLGGASRTGKGMLLRNLICGLGLDPTVNLRLVAGAKPGEHAGYAPVCATFFGREPRRLIVLLEELLEEGKRREDILIDRKKAKASQRDLEEFPLEVLIIDEFKQYASATVLVPDPSGAVGSSGEPKMVKAADRIAHLLEELAAFVAALNITIMLSTQDPDANTIPRGFKSNSVARVATRTMSPVQTNAILKDGATGAGMVAHEIPKSLKGSAIVDIDGYEGEIIRSCFIEDEKHDGAQDIIAAGVALRREVGRAPGQFTDSIEDALADRTGFTSAAGGAGGFGRPSPVDGGAEEVTVLDSLVRAAEATGRGVVTKAEVFAYLAAVDERYARGEDESDHAYAIRAGKLLTADLDGQAIKDVKVDDGTGSRTMGFRLDDLRNAR